MIKIKRKPSVRTPRKKTASRPPAKAAAGRSRVPDHGRGQRTQKGKRPVVAAPATPAPRPDTSRPRAMAIAQVGLAKKAEDVLLLDVRGLTSYADYFVVMSADSERQASAIADAIDEQLEAQGATKIGVEGQSGGRWVLIDYGDVVAHVFHPEARSLYDIEGLWADAPRIVVEG
jgi:ribosome-associated protein